MVGETDQDRDKNGDQVYRGAGRGSRISVTGTSGRNKMTSSRQLGHGGRCKTN